MAGVKRMAPVLQSQQHQEVVVVAGGSRRWQQPDERVVRLMTKLLHVVIKTEVKALIEAKIEAAGTVVAEKEAEVTNAVAAETAVKGATAAGLGGTQDPSHSTVQMATEHRDRSL